MKSTKIWNEMLPREAKNRWILQKQLFWFKNHPEWKAKIIWI
jgi:hypothetical protein